MAGQAVSVAIHAGEKINETSELWILTGYGSLSSPKSTARLSHLFFHPRAILFVRFTLTDR